VAKWGIQPNCTQAATNVHGLGRALGSEGCYLPRLRRVTKQARIAYARPTCRTWLAAVALAGPMPGTDIPVVHPSELAVRRPDAVLLFVPDLLAEVRDAFPEVEDTGGRWVDAATLGS
jgi:C-methyltransferase C-terminal domain